MLITEQDEKISTLGTDEYFFLTENLESIDPQSVRKAVRYIVFNKRRRLLEIVKEVMNNELSELERHIALDFWDKKISADDIAKMNGIGRSSVYRNIGNIRKKLEKSLKYVLLYDLSSLPTSADELLEFVKGEYVEN
ncbi:MAG: sigma-70 family RNA polymerase sigma factor [Oscillospiraceae bacterium]|nr:sigma-70 family RNA polymerase sigma factor [Oscillospiraceae bacterium]